MKKKKGCLTICGFCYIQENRERGRKKVGLEFESSKIVKDKKKKDMRWNNFNLTEKDLQLRRFLGGCLKKRKKKC